ncbi:hypothetical protein FS837_010738 [Tulasnella sp. UAMH 9824]|nr:hypothetical protein FS837_010738 [Tulasnella sp. UAMH 9824]
MSLFICDNFRSATTSNVPPHQKLLLSTHCPSEADMYDRHVSLLNYVAKFFRDERKDVDRHWAPAQQPTYPPAKPQAGPLLERGQAGLKPDLCLMIQPGDEPEKSTESEGKPKNKKSGGKPKVLPSEGKPNVVPHWKNVGVAFELKPEKNPTTTDG